MAKRTGWIAHHKKPIREGWYERDYTSIFGGGIDPLPHVHLDLWLQKSPGDGFWYVDEPKGQINDAYYENLPWRGLSSNAELRGAKPIGEASRSNDVLGVD